MGTLHVPAAITQTLLDATFRGAHNHQSSQQETRHGNLFKNVAYPNRRYHRRLRNRTASGNG